MATKPFIVFSKTIARANSLIELHDQEPKLAEPDDLARAAVILAVAGFDRYFTAKFCDVLVTRLKSKKTISPDLYERLEKAGFGTEFALRLLLETVENRSSRPFRKIRTIVQNSLSNHTTHRDGVIDALFLSLDLKNLSENASKKAGQPSLSQKVMKLVDLRNEIAHEAHVKQNGEPRSLNVGSIRTMIGQLEKFVKACDEIVDARFGKQVVAE